MRNKRVLALVAMLIAVAGVSFLVFWGVDRQRTVASAGMADSGVSPGTLAFDYAALSQQSAARSGAQSAKPAVARVNPYSVVRHGICVPGNAPNQEEESRKKWEALLQDPFWQSIFAGVYPEKFHLETTRLAMYRYVTYWKMEKGQLIHWTGRKILIRAGTRLFTDGKGEMFLCACGNQVAAVLPPKAPGTILPPEEEPPVAYLVPPEPDPLPLIPEGVPSRFPLVAPPELVRAPPYGGPVWSLPPPPIFVGGSPPGGGREPVPPTPVQPPVVPEPGTLSLTLIGLGACVVERRRRKRQ